MIERLGEYIDKELFMQNLYRHISNYRQLVVDLFISNSCNLHCKHCYFLDYKPQSSPLPLQKWFDIIDESIKAGIKHFHFSGKEPFCEHRIPLVLERLNQLSSIHGLKYGLITNGTRLTTKYLQELLDSNLSYIEFSLEGDMDYNHSIRNSNSYETIYQLVKKQPEKSKINISSTYFGNNLISLERMIDEFSEIGVKKFNIAPYLEFDNNVLPPIKEIDPALMIELVNHFHHYLETRKNRIIDIRVCISSNQAYELFMKTNSLSDRINKYVYNKKKIVYNLDGSVLEVNFPLFNIPFLTQIIISNDGYVFPCADDIHYKNLKEISLGEIRDSNMESILKKRKEFIISYINQSLHIK